MSGNRKKANPSDYFEVEGIGSSDDGEIKVKTHTGKIISLEVKGSDTIGSMKLKIMAEENIPYDQQELIFNERVLDNIDTFANLHIKKESTLTLMRKTSGTKYISIKIASYERMFEVKPSDTIGYLKSKYYNKGDLLIFNKVVLEDSGTFADYNIVNGSVLTCIFKSSRSMEISVNTYTGETISLLVDSTCTIFIVKSLIGYDAGIPIDEQALVFNKTILGDSGTLFDFNINRNSTLTLMRKSRRFMTIYIKTITENIISLEVKPSDTIERVKAKLQDEEGIAYAEHELIFNEMVLDNEDTLADLHVKEESTLTLMRFSVGTVHIFIKPCSGENITLDVKLSDTIQNVKSKIKGKIGILSSRQILAFNGTCLEDSATLADYHICNESIVNLDT